MKERGNAGGAFLRDDCFANVGCTPLVPIMETSKDIEIIWNMEEEGGHPPKNKKNKNGNIIIYILYHGLIQYN